MVTELQSEDKTIRLIPGETEELQVMVLPEDATNPEPEWTSQNEEIATVDETGHFAAYMTEKP